MPSPDVRWLSNDLGMIDLAFTGIPRVLAAYVLVTDDGLAVVDCGPTTVLDTLLAGIRALGHDPTELRHVLATHIHLDHTGAAGTLLGLFPVAHFYVHERGAPHMLDPTNLIRSATRIYGDDMERLWGAFDPVPAERTVVLANGNQLQVGERTIDVIYTPGHASHHVAFHDLASSVVFAGDVAGVRVPPSTLVVPPTPPPDIDVPAWKQSIAQLRSLKPNRLMLAHFGPVDDVDRHLDALETELDAFVALAERSIAQGDSRDGLVERLREHVHALIVADGHADIEQPVSIASSYGMAADGLLRYLRKRDE